MTLTLRLFGALALQRDGVPLPRPRIRKDHWLLALLVLRSDRDTERSFLAGTFWPDANESQALFYLRRSLNELRQVLGPDAARLTSPTTRTLRLETTGMEIDVLHFDAAIARGDAASLETAVDLYHGDLLADCDEPFALPEREARREAYVTALQRLALMKVNTDAATAVSYLRRAAGIDPLNEALQRALMEALVWNGDFASMQQSYRDFQQRLQDDLQSEPDPETVAHYYRLREQVRQTAPTLSRISVHPVPTATSQAQGANEALLPSTNLPRSLTSFIGREQEKVEVKRLLHQKPLLTLTGMGGSGKTRLSLEVGAEVLADYPDGVWLVELAPLSEPTLVVQKVATAVGIQEKAGTPLLQTLLASLQRKRLLLLLDNCEHLVTACADLVNSLLLSCPHVSVLASSREALGIMGEQLFRVPCLALPDSQHSFSSVRLLQYEAIQLFVERAALVRPDFVITAANASAVVSVCQRLDGLPLALELAAARVRGMGVEVIQTRLDDRFHLLTGGNRTVPPRHQTLRALIDWSYDLLSEAEQRLLARVSVFAGGWTLEAAERVAGNVMGGKLPADCQSPDAAPPKSPPVSQSSSQPFIPTDEVLDLLLSLVDKSLVLVEEQGGMTRYHLLETVQAYARERLEALNEKERILARHREWCAEYMEAARANLRGPAAVVWLDRIEAEHDNLRLALAVASDTTSFRIAATLWWFWYVRGYWSEGRERLAELLKASEHTLGGDEERARMLRGAGMLADGEGDYAAARALCEESLMLFHKIKDRQEAASVLGSLGIIAKHQGDFDAARNLLQESVLICQEIGDRYGMVTKLINLGNLTRDQGDHVAARGFYEESLKIGREVGDRRGMASGLNNLADVIRSQGDYDAAVALYQESLALYREVGDRHGMADVVHNQGRIAQDRKNYSTAQSLLEDSLQICREIGDRHNEGLVRNDLGMLALMRGDYGAARSQFEESMRIWQEIKGGKGLVGTLERIAALCSAEGKAATAARLWGEAEARREVLGIPLPITERDARNLAVAELQRALGEEAFSTAWQEGRTMTET